LKFVLLNSPSPDLSLESPERDTLLEGFGVILHGRVAKTETEVLGQGELRSDSSVRGELHASGVLARALDVRATTQKFMPLLA